MAARNTQSNRTVTISRWRINAILIVVVLITSQIIIRLGNLQVVQHKELSGSARAEFDRTETIQPQRGVIRDRMGNVLAIDVDRESLYVDTRLVDPEEAQKLALVLSGLIGKPSGDILENLLDKPYYHRLARWLKPEISAQIAKLEEPGLVLVPEPRRVYPQETYAAQVIGAVNHEGVGISGIEAYFDYELKGITGTVTAEWDSLGNPIWLDPPETKPAMDGVDLELTLDPLVQHVVENEIKAVVDQFKPKGVTIIVMEPKTGAIRGMASYPTFDPNRYNDYSEDIYGRNPAVTDVYEPGSTFKILTVAAGMQAKAFTADTQVNDTGVVERYGQPLSNWNGGGNGMIDPGKVLYYSSNVGALQFAEMMGTDNFYKAIADFGFGKPTGVDLAGEQAGIVNDPSIPGWSPIVMDTNAYGQGIAVTPLQLVRMVAAIANDGKLMRPYIVQKRCKADVCEETAPEQVGQPVEPGVAWTVRRMMVHAANHYAPVVWGSRTGDHYSDTWLVPGYQVGAKTGTADIADGNGGYTGRVIGSVAGFAPAEDARYAILVKVDEPSGDQYGLVSAIPAYQHIVEQLMRYERLAPDMALVGPGQESYVTTVAGGTP